jgi:hypothetical protein
MGEKKEKLKSTLGWIALGCAIAVACVAAAPLLAVTGVVVAGVSISAAAVTGTTAVVAAVGATAALTKAGLHLSDGEYDEAAASAVMAVPMISATRAYGSMYLNQVKPPGNMTTGASGSQAGSGQNLKPNQNAGKTDPNSVEFNGKTVTQDNSLFDPNAVVDDMGRTNIQRMEQRLAPIGYDGTKVSIHHIDQTNTGPVMEISTSVHQQGYSSLHTNVGQSPSLINRSTFDTWRGDYWEWRANDFK